MWPETKRAVSRALWASQAIWSLPADKCVELLRSTASVRCPDRNELRKRVLASLGDEMVEKDELESIVDECLVSDMRRLYAKAAVEAGFDERHGLAVLEYVALLKDIGDA